MRERSNWRIEDIYDAGNGRGLSLFEEPLLALRHRTQTWNGTPRSQQPFRVQTTTTTSSVMRKKELLPGYRWIVSFKGVNRRKQNLCRQHQPILWVDDQTTPRSSWVAQAAWWSVVMHSVFLKKYLYVFVYLAALGLSCGTWHLSSSLWHTGSFSCGI